MRSLRSGVAAAALAVLWSSAAFGFNLFGSSDDTPKKAKAEPPAQAQKAENPGPAADDTASPAKTLAANLDAEIEKAKTQRALGDYGAAAHALAQMMLVAPDDARVVGEYGKVLVLLGRSDDAIAFLKRAIELSPNDWTLYSAIGAAFDQKNQFTDAQTAYQRGLALNPNSAALLNNYAMSRMLAGDLPGAQALIAQAQAKGNDPKIAHNAALMASLRGTAAPEAVAAHPVIATAAPVPASVPPKPAAAPAPKIEPQKSEPAKEAAVSKPEAVKTASVAPASSMNTPAAAAKPIQKALPKPVSTASLPPTAPATKPLPQKPEAVTSASQTDAKPIIVKTETGRVMMQAVPKDPEAGPVKSEAATGETQTAQTDKTEATAPPRTLASAAKEGSPTPDLRAASD